MPNCGRDRSTANAAALALNRGPAQARRNVLWQVRYSPLNLDSQQRTDNLPSEVADRLGWYVYLYVDPRTSAPFYVGKGRGSRVYAHFSDVKESEKTRLIVELAEAGIEPRLEILAHGLEDEQTAFRVEAAAIDLLGLASLTNQIRGWRSLETGRMTLDELRAFYAAVPVEITDAALLIRVNRFYRRNMSAEELFEVTRGIWRLGPRRHGAEFAFAVFHGVVREVYRIGAWYPAGTLSYATRDLSQYDLSGRWEFQGEFAAEPLRARYLGRSVRQYFRKGSQAPVLYVNC